MGVWKLKAKSVFHILESNKRFLLYNAIKHTQNLAAIQYDRNFNF